MCEHTKQLIASKLVAWMDGELAEREAAEVATHVARCAECRERLAAYKQASAGFEMYCDVVVDVAEDARVAEERREIPRRCANDLRSFATLTRDDNVKGWGAGKQKRVRVAMAAGAIAAAAAIAMLLMLPRQHVAQAPARATAPAHNSASTPAQGGTLHAAQRALPAMLARIPAPAQNAAQRTAPLAVPTGAAQRRGAGRPGRPEDANRAARQQTAQNGQMRNVSAALRPESESRPQAENASAAEPPIEIAVPTENMFPPGAVPEGIGFTAVVTIAADDSAQLAALRRR